MTGGIPGEKSINAIMSMRRFQELHAQCWSVVCFSWVVGIERPTAGHRANPAGRTPDGSTRYEEI